MDTEWKKPVHKGFRLQGHCVTKGKTKEVVARVGAGRRDGYAEDRVGHKTMRVASS